MARADGSAQNWSTTVTGTVEPGPNSNKWYNTWATCRGVWSRVNPTNGTFSLPGVMLYPGSNVLDVAVVDVSGNVAHQTRSVFKTITNCFETFYHDNNGNMTNWINGSQNVVSQWDWADRLTKVTANGNVMVQNWYDASSRRIAKKEYSLPGVLYLYDGWEIVGVLNANGSLLETFTRGVGIAGDIGTLVATTPHGSGSSYPLQTYAHHNHRGDIVAVRSGTSTITRYTYSAFGSLISVTGPDSSRFKFSSKERDVRTELYYYGYRFYSPQWQRWLSRDPIGSRGGYNVFAFCNNMPTVDVDTKGLITGGAIATLVRLSATALMKKCDDMCETKGGCLNCCAATWLVGLVADAGEVLLLVEVPPAAAGDAVISTIIYLWNTYNLASAYSDCAKSCKSLRK